MRMGIATFSRASSEAIRLCPWKMKPMYESRRSGSSDSRRPCSFSPKRNPSPLVGASTHPRMDSSVVFPLPDGPTSIMNSPCFTVRSMPLSAWKASAPVP